MYAHEIEVAIQRLNQEIATEDEELRNAKLYEEAAEKAWLAAKAQFSIKERDAKENRSAILRRLQQLEDLLERISSEEKAFQDTGAWLTPPDFEVHEATAAYPRSFTTSGKSHDQENDNGTAKSAKSSERRDQCIELTEDDCEHETETNSLEDEAESEEEIQKNNPRKRLKRKWSLSTHSEIVVGRRPNPITSAIQSGEARLTTSAHVAGQSQDRATPGSTDLQIVQSALPERGPDRLAMSYTTHTGPETLPVEFNMNKTVGVSINSPSREDVTTQPRGKPRYTVEQQSAQASQMTRQQAAFYPSMTEEYRQEKGQYENHRMPAEDPGDAASSAGSSGTGLFIPFQRIPPKIPPIALAGRESLQPPKLHKYPSEARDKEQLDRGVSDWTLFDKTYGSPETQAPKRRRLRTP